MRAIRGFLAELAVWLLPLIVVAEYVGTTFGNTVAATIALYALFALILWVSPPEKPATGPRHVWLTRAGRVGGLLLLGASAVGMWNALAPALDPIHHRMPNLGDQRVREAFLYAPSLWAIPLAFSFRLLRGRSSSRDYERLGLFIALGFLAHLVGKLGVQGLPVLPYRSPRLPSALLAAEGTLLLLAFVPRIPRAARIGALLGAGLGLRYLGLETWQLNPATRDMLPLVKSAQDALLAGHSPYALHQMQFGSVVPLTYLPGLWLSFGLPRLFGADLRLLGLLADAAVVLGLHFAASGIDPRWRSRAQGIALGFGAVWLFSPSLMWNGIYAEPHAWWLWLALLLAATTRRRWWLAAAALGVAFATRHFSIVVGPFVLLAMLRDLGWRAALPRVALTGAIAAALFLPFALSAPEAFWFGTYRWLVEYGPVHQSWFWEKFGFSGPLYHAHAEAWMPRAQAIVPLVFLLLAVFVRGRRRVIAPLGSAYVLFVMFNGIVWDSFYLGCSLFAAFAAAGGYALDPRALRPARPIARWCFWLGVVGTGAAALAAGILLLTLTRAESRAGAERAASTLTRVLERGDVLVDRSDWNVAFVRGKPLIDARTSATYARDALDPRLGPSGVFGRNRVFFAFRADREREEQAALGIAGKLFDDQRFERYRVFGLEGLGVIGRLSSQPDDAVVRSCRIGGAARPMLGTQPARENPVTLSWASVTLGRALVVVAGADDAQMVWGHEAVELTLSIDARRYRPQSIPNLPGLHFFSVDTSNLRGPHAIGLRVRSSDEQARWFCVDGWIIGR